jgi:gluconate 2-dehydrogenase gamma chain
MADGPPGGWNRGAALNHHHDVKHVFQHLTQAEVLFLDAAVARLIPADELGPGAKEAGITCFIDGQLASSWGTHGRNYRMGPWQEGTPEQGYQSPLTPQELYRAAIRETNLHCVKQFGKAFSLLSLEQQDEVLHALENGKVELESVASNVFFGLLWRNTQEGFFADPLYGGNKDKIGWRLIGFPGVAAGNYPSHMGRFNVPYRVEPVSILDIREGRVEVDAQGYPKHVMLDDEQ